MPQGRFQNEQKYNKSHVTFYKKNHTIAKDEELKMSRNIHKFRTGDNIK